MRKNFQEGILLMVNSKRLSYTFTGLLVLIGLVLIWRAFYGVNYNDEMYYADCLYRLYQGDVYLVHDWQIHIMSFIPVYPFYALFHLITGSNEGVILYLRILYTIFQLGVATVCFLRLRHLGWGSLFVSLVYLLFTPFNIAAMSYNTMGLGFAMLVFSLLTGPKHHPRRDFILCGICLAFCILSTPFALILYILYGAVCIIQSLLCKYKKYQGWDEFSLSAFMWITAGAFLIFLIFGILLLQRASLSELSQTFLYNFRMPGYEQNPSQWVEKLSGYFDRVYSSYPYLIWWTGLASLISVFDKKRTAHALWYLLPSTGLVLYYLYTYSTQYHVPTNFCIMPLAFLGFLCFFLLPRKNWKYFWLWFVPGMLYSLCSHFASDTGILCITSSFVLCSSIGSLFLFDCGQEIIRNSGVRWMGKAAAGCIFAALTVHLCVTGYLRITFFYNEAPLSELTAQVKVGPAKGLYTTSSMAAFHSDRVEGLQSLALTEKDTLLVMGMEPWAYLCTDASCAAYSCWDSYDEYLYKVYLDIFPEKYPSIVYSTNFEQDLAEKPFLQELIDQGYEIVDLNTATALMNPDR